VYIIAMLAAVWAPLFALVLFFSVPVLHLLLVTFISTDPRTRVAAGDL